MTDLEYIASLVERETHSDTMRPLSPLERQHLADWRAHFETRKVRTGDDWGDTECARLESNIPLNRVEAENGEPLGDEPERY